MAMVADTVMAANMAMAADMAMAMSINKIRKCTSRKDVYRRL